MIPGTPSRVNNLGKNLVMIACLIALGAFGTWLYLRPRLPAGNGFTDGEERISAARLRDDIRLAHWDEPQLLGGAFEGTVGTTDPFVDEATGRTFFTVDGPGGGLDLWVLDPRVAAQARPLLDLNTPHSETAACFHDGWLFFASDRPGGSGGFDLYRGVYD